jgi:ferredoxin
LRANESALDAEGVVRPGSGSSVFPSLFTGMTPNSKFYTFSVLRRRCFSNVQGIGGKMKIVIDKDKCKGHNNCMSIAPNVFEVDEKFKAFVLDPKGDSDEDILKAAKACPELAIILSDENSGKQIFPGPDDKTRSQLGGSKWGE